MIVTERAQTKMIVTEWAQTKMIEIERAHWANWYIVVIIDFWCVFAFWERL